MKTTVLKNSESLVQPKSRRSEVMSDSLMSDPIPWIQGYISTLKGTSRDLIS